LANKKAAIKAAFAVPGSPNEQVFHYTLDTDVTFEKPGSIPLPTAAWDLYLAFHGAHMLVLLDLTVQRQGGGLMLAKLGISGEVTDLYDFNYEQQGFWDLFHAGGTLQIGWDQAKGRNAGLIFLVKAALAGAYDNTDWNPLNNWPFNFN
jgi:hypothetical protein